MGCTNQRNRLAIGRKVLALFAMLSVAAMSFLLPVMTTSQKAVAITNTTMNFQARLMNGSGAIVPDGYYNARFKLYDALSGGTNLWTETYYDSNGGLDGNDNRVRVMNGYLTVSLGSQTSFPSNINWDQQLWITMNIGGMTQTASPTWDGEMNPRLQLTAVPYSFRAGQLAGGNGTDVTVLDTGTPSGSNLLHLPAESGTLCVQNSTACGFASSSGNENYIQNGTAVQTNANIAIQGASDTGISLLIRQRPAQSADMLRVEDSNSNPYLRIDGYGGLHVAQSSSLDGVVGIGGMGASSGEKLRIGILNATDVGLNIYGNGSQTADLLRITAGGTQPILAVGGSGQAAFQNRTDSTTALTVSNASSRNVFGVDTANGQTVLGAGGTLAGLLVFSNATNTNKTTLVSSAATAGRTITLPNETGTVCTTGSVCTGYAPASGSGSYIQNGTSLQSNASFIIQSAADTNITAALRSRASQTADLLQIQSSTGGISAGIRPSGAIYSAPISDPETDVPGNARLFVQPLAAASTAIIARVSAGGSPDGGYT